MKAEALEAIGEQIKKCRNCRLYASRRKAVPGIGPSTADIYLIAEAPGEQEDRRGIPLVGDAGKKLSKLFTEEKLPRERFFLSNMVRCRPPGNRDPRVDEIQACDQWTQDQIAVIEPKLIVAVGRFAAEHYFPDGKIKEIHGCLTRSDDRLVMATYHPAAALHQANLAAALKSDYNKLGKVIRNL